MSDNKVETELLLQIKEVLLKFPKYWEKDVLLRNKSASIYSSRKYINFDK